MDIKIKFLRVGFLGLYLVLKIVQAILLLYTGRPKIQHHHIKNILVINLGGIGDVILSTPTLRALRKRFPCAYIAVMVWPTYGAHEVIEGNPYVDEILVSDSMVNMNFFKIIDFLSMLRKKRFDMTVSTVASCNREAAFISFLTGARYRFGPSSYKYDPDGYEINYDSLYNFTMPIDEKKHLLEQNLDLLQPLGLNTKNFDMDICISDDDKKYCRDFLIRHGISQGDILIGFHIGSGFHKWKRWDVKRFAEVGDELAQKYRAKIIIFGGPFERKLTEKMSYLMRANPIIATNNTIKQTAALIERCNIITSNDSALAHVAAAVKTKVIAIFGPTNFYWAAPHGEIHTTVRKDIPCSPCHLKIGQTNPKCQELNCLNLITAQEVLQEADKHLKSMCQSKKI
jgi:ADP-heptose:LPS heptosyltransferase